MPSQCAIPAFEGILPDDHDNILMEVLSNMAEWHALAKLRMHTDDTLRSLHIATETLYSALRKFTTITCTAFNTRELPREVRARQRRAEQNSGATRMRQRNDDTQSGSKQKKFNLNTYKLHSLGDYVGTILECGTTDSYSTLLVSCFCYELVCCTNHLTAITRPRRATLTSKLGIDVQTNGMQISRSATWSGFNIILVRLSIVSSHQNDPLQQALMKRAYP